MHTTEASNNSLKKYQIIGHFCFGVFKGAVFIYAHKKTCMYVHLHHVHLKRNLIKILHLHSKRL